MLAAVRIVKYSEGLAPQLNSVYNGMFTALLESCTVASQVCLVVP